MSVPGLSAALSGLRVGAVGADKLRVGTDKLRVGVVGAGVVGLSTAFRVLQEFREKVQVEILADKFDVDTTSDGAAGLFRPVMTPYENQCEEQFKRWSQTSWDHYSSLFFSDDAEEIGVVQCGGYHIYSRHMDPEAPPPVYKDIVYHFHELSASELASFPVGGKTWLSGYYFNSLVVECRRYLPWLRKSIQSLGGTIKEEKVEKLESLSGRFDLVFNCCGIGARDLVGDTSVVPIRGQIIRADAPQLKHFYFFDDESYIVPCFDSLVIGGIRQKGNYNCQVSDEDTEVIWQRARRYLPTLRKTEAKWHWAGLRPHRDPVRVELELLPIQSSASAAASATASPSTPSSASASASSSTPSTVSSTHLPVIHNYGHGGHGVTLSWGTAVNAVDLMKQNLEFAI